MNSVAIEGKTRETLGKKATKAVRSEGLVPCVIYGGENVVHFTAHPLDFKKVIYTRDFNLVDITVDGKTYQCILKSAQFHPVTDDIVHLDFVELVKDHAVRVEIPIRFQGVAPGVKTGGKLIQKLRRAKVKTTPEHLVEALMIDVSKLQLGHSIRVKDIIANENIEIMNSPGIPVASVEIPRALRSADAKGEGEEDEESEGEGEEGAEGGGEE